MLKARVAVLTVFVAAALVCLVLATGVSVNYDMVKYLPEQAPSTLALNQMQAAYNTGMPNLRVMLPQLTLTQALEYKARIAACPGVEAVLWLDDGADVLVPLEVQDSGVVDDWYKDGTALFTVTVDDSNPRIPLTAIREVVGPSGAMSGNPVDTVGAQNTTSSEVARMVSFIIPILLVILLLATTSWFEVVLFLLNVGVAVAINSGTNIVFGQISFITQATASILQLACSMDYAIFLLDRFREERAGGLEPVEAMTQAVRKSISSISASGLTTVVGFLALVAMRFKIGPDMGFVLAKGIGFSLLATLVFLPCMAICCYRLIERTQHRSLLPSFAGLARVSNRIKGPVTLGVVVLLLPCFLAQQHTAFMYGTAGMSAPDSQIAIERQAINDVFGEAVPFAMLVPKGSLATEMALCDDLKAMPEVTSLQSYVETVGNTIPQEFLPPDQLAQLNSNHYTRIILTAALPPESVRTFAFAQRLRDILEAHYPGAGLLVGESMNIYDMKEIIQADTVKVNAIAIGAIAVILLLTFRSLSLPLLLLVTIEASIFINTAVPYFAGQTLNYIGYLIISSIQLGATIDYAILFANRYYENRAVTSRRDTTAKTIRDCAGSIFTSGGIMIAAGIVLSIVSTNQVVSQLGVLIARGSALSAVLVIVFLPAMLTWLEPLIRRTSLGLTFFDKPAERSEIL